MAKYLLTFPRLAIFNSGAGISRDALLLLLKMRAALLSRTILRTPCSLRHGSRVLARNQSTAGHKTPPDLYTGRKAICKLVAKANGDVDTVLSAITSTLRREKIDKIAQKRRQLERLVDDVVPFSWTVADVQLFCAELGLRPVQALAVWLKAADNALWGTIPQSVNATTVPTCDLTPTDVHARTSVIQQAVEAFAAATSAQPISDLEQLPGCRNLLHLLANFAALPDRRRMMATLVEAYGPKKLVNNPAALNVTEGPVLTSRSHSEALTHVKAARSPMDPRGIDLRRVLFRHFSELSFVDQLVAPPALMANYLPVTNWDEYSSKSFDDYVRSTRHIYRLNFHPLARAFSAPRDDDAAHVARLQTQTLAFANELESTFALIPAEDRVEHKGWFAGLLRMGGDVERATQMKKRFFSSADVKKNTGSD